MCFRKDLQSAGEAGSFGREQFYTAAVWFLRRQPERILLVLCNAAGKPTEIGTVMDAEPTAILENLRSFVQPDMLCHIACLGRNEELAVLQKNFMGIRLGMVLSLTERWEPVWI